MTGFIAVDMLAEISKALEYENDWTQLKDGVLECQLRDQYDGEHTGLARVTVNKAGKVSVMAWSDNPYEYATIPDPDWTREYDSADPEAIAEDIWNRCPYCGRESDKCVRDRWTARLGWCHMSDKTALGADVTVEDKPDTLDRLMDKDMKVLVKRHAYNLPQCERAEQSGLGLAFDDWAQVPTLAKRLLKKNAK